MEAYCMKCKKQVGLRILKKSLPRMAPPPHGEGHLLRLRYQGEQVPTYQEIGCRKHIRCDVESRGKIQSKSTGLALSKRKAIASGKSGCSV